MRKIGDIDVSYMGRCCSRRSMLFLSVGSVLCNHGLLVILRLFHVWLWVLLLLLLLLGPTTRARVLVIFRGL